MTFPQRPEDGRSEAGVRSTPGGAFLSTQRQREQGRPGSTAVGPRPDPFGLHRTNLIVRRNKSQEVTHRGHRSQATAGPESPWALVCHAARLNVEEINRGSQRECGRNIAEVRVFSGLDRSFPHA